MSEHTNTDAEILAGIDAAVAAGTMTVFTPPTLTINRVRFLEEDAYAAGGVPSEAYDNVMTEVFDWDADDTHDEIVDGAVRILQREGLTFSATGADWAGNPDGSRITDYATAEREETSAHLTGFSVALLAEIVGRVG
jgi:hypothetical protein